MKRNPEVQNSGEYRTAVLTHENLSPLHRQLDDNFVQSTIEKGYFNDYDSDEVVDALNDYLVSPSVAGLDERLRKKEGGPQ